MFRSRDQSEYKNNKQWQTATVFFRGEILDLIFETDLGENLNKTFDGEFESSFSEVRKESF